MGTVTTAAALSLILSSAISAVDFLPLQEGNQWTYTMSNGMQMATKIVGFENVGAVRCAIAETAMGGQTSREYLAADAQGIKAYMSQTQGREFRYDPPMLRVKLPYQEGDTWEATVSQFGMAMTTSSQSIGREQVQTPVGTFDAIKIRATVNMGPGQSMVSTTWYAAGIGPVRQVMQMGGQELNAMLASTNVKPAPETQAATTVTLQSPTVQSPTEIRCPKCGAKVPAGAKFCPECGTKLEQPKPVAPTVCPKCGAKFPAGAKFCPACGQKIETPATAPEPGQPPTGATTASARSQPALEKYQSADGKVLLYKPPTWTVTEGETLGPGIYAVSVTEPQENAAVVFLTFQVDETIKDSVVLAAKCIEALRQEFPDLKVANLNSTPERERTIADLSLTADGEKGAGHGYFFRTQSIGTVFLLLAKADQWNALRPTLTTIAANLAYTPQGVAAVVEQGRRLAEQEPASAGQGTSLSPPVMLQQAERRPGKQVPLQLAALPDQSMSMQIPQGWVLEGQKIQFTAVNNAQTRTHGLGYVCHTIIPMDIPVSGVITAPYQPPPQALNLVLQFGRTGADVQVIGEYPADQAVPALAQSIQQMRAQGSQVDARLIHARFRNVPTGTVSRGLFSVMCSIRSMTPVWQVSIQGSWAPDNEFEEWLPLYLRVEKTIQVNQQWMGQEMQNRAVVQQQLNRNLQRSIAESNQAFDDYLGSLRNADRSRDYISHMWSQTTLGQGTWVAENEGARVYQTDSWGIQGPEGRIDSPAYNTTNFTGENPWGGGNLELVDTRAEYERYIANR